MAGDERLPSILFWLLSSTLLLRLAHGGNIRHLTSGSGNRLANDAVGICLGFGCKRNALQEREGRNQLLKCSGCGPGGQETEDDEDWQEATCVPKKITRQGYTALAYGTYKHNDGNQVLQYGGSLSVDADWKLAAAGDEDKIDFSMCLGDNPSNQTTEQITVRALIFSSAPSKPKEKKTWLSAELELASDTIGGRKRKTAQVKGQGFFKAMGSVFKNNPRWSMGASEGIVYGSSAQFKLADSHTMRPEDFYNFRLTCQNKRGSMKSRVKGLGTCDLTGFTTCVQLLCPKLSDAKMRSDAEREKLDEMAQAAVEQKVAVMKKAQEEADRLLEQQRAKYYSDMQAAQQQAQQQVMAQMQQQQQQAGQAPAASAGFGGAQAASVGGYQQPYPGAQPHMAPANQQATSIVQQLPGGQSMSPISLPNAESYNRALSMKYNAGPAAAGSLTAYSAR